MDQSLLVFTTVVEQKNFTRAAELLHMTQPAVSNYIQSLEKNMGIKLLERTNKYVRLSKAGEIVFHHATEILGLYARMERLIDDLKHTASGPISIGASYTFGEYILPHKIASMLKMYPLVNPIITIKNSHEIINLLMKHKIDVGIIEGETNADHLKMIPFAIDELSITVPSNHPLATANEIDPLLLHLETWLVREEGSGTREMQEKGFKQMGFSPKKCRTFGSTQVIKESIEAGLGISILSHASIKNELELGKVKILEIDGFPISRNFSIITPQVEFHTKAVEIFIESLVKKTTS
ncbi:MULTISPECIES: LysR family transcriptional regulator [Mesobacillus]|uniref:Transcriptional regulator n=2 Tax=Mesobacillus TaxID=2675231 RepID=A0A0D6ZC47_9BACI|nr:MULTISPECIES: LysR family transcriptional regulator [Mesobacillus]KIY23379.1 transcriptional regulator [Mesobacillus subterraneus]MDQ0413147.1 DNA-binding transcriptional LysR family regulator [Mesobacillus stamsii]